MAVFLALAASCLWGAADFGGGLLSRRLRAPVVVGLSQAAALVVVTVAALATGGFAGPWGWAGWSVAAGLSGTAGLVCFYLALASGKMGVVSPITTLGVIVPVLVGLASGERPRPLAVAGMVLAVAGAVAASGPELRGGAATGSVVLSALAGLGFGSGLVFIAHGAKVSPLMTLWGMRAVTVALFGAGALLLRSLGGLHRADLGPVALVGITDASANLLYAVASRHAFLSITAVLASLYPVVTLLLARALLHERLQLVQIVGVVVTLGGVAMVSLR